MRISTLPTLIGLLAMGLLGPHAMKAQPLQQGIVVVNDPSDDQVSATLAIPDATGQGCLDNYFSAVPPNWPINSPSDDSGSQIRYWSLNGTPDAQGNCTFDVITTVSLSWWTVGWNFQSSYVGLKSWQLLIDGAACATCSIQALEPDVVYPGDGNILANTWLTPPNFTSHLRITHRAGDAWDHNGVRHFTLRLTRFGTADLDIRFNAIMVGTNYTNVLGYFDAPQMPLSILRDPPGDKSYSSITSSQEGCFGQTMSVSTDQSQNVWAKAKVGVQGSTGFIVETDYELYGEVGVDLTAGRTETGDREYRTCLSSTSEFTTAQDGEPDDVFIGSALRYAYGFGKIVSRQGCLPVKDARFCMTPVNVISSYNYSESWIRSSIIPDLQDLIVQLVQGTPERKRAEAQLDVWNQVLSMNDAIKAGGPLEVTRNFNGGGNGQNWSLTKSTSQTQSITTSVFVESAISAEFGAYVGGSGVSAGGELRTRTEYGSGQNASNASTNTMAYHLEDDDAGDNFSVQVRSDAVYGTYAFSLDEDVSASSCPYEGGYQIEQPQLWVGSVGNSQMTVDEVPLGSQAIFPLYVCNNSTQQRTYYLKFVAASNSEGGQLEAYGNAINGNDDGVQLLIPANTCLDVTNLYLTQPNAGVVNFEDIEVYLYSICDPSIRSSVNVSAYFGEGNINVGDYCVPTSSIGPAEGDFIDGVQLGDINNTGNGGLAGASYTDYTGDFSTSLSLNEQAMITLTCGSYGYDDMAAWIDYDQSGTFEPSEMLGTFVATAPFQSNNILFTVPGSASLGTTRMRVRLVYGANIDPCSSFDYSEVEDYTIVINDETPVDCQNTTGGTAWPGTPCDDGSALTGNDTWSANCACSGVGVDCAGVPNGTSFPGSGCDDGNANTVSDVYGTDCQCVGVPLDCTGQPGGSNLPGTPCDDQDNGTGNDAYGIDCVCSGQFIDCLNQPGGTALPGWPCDDGNPLSSNDLYNAQCQCAGTLTNDCLGVFGGSAQPGYPCDDQNPQTGFDTYGPNCICAGLPLDCNGIPNGPNVPGAFCNDWNPQTINDVISANCVCLGTLIGNDCEGVAGGPAQPGTACDDGDAATGNDTYNANCSCAGQLIDCFGTIGGLALPGYPCDDSDATTGADAYGNDCQCAGLLIDCVGSPGGTALPGTSCDDGNPNSLNDAYNASCACVGSLANDCQGVPGGAAQPGTPCDDGQVNTGNDTWSANCQCSGLPYDCAGVPGGSAGTGTACNDQDDCTSGDIWSLDCTCEGTALQISAVSGNGTIDVGTTNTYHITPIPGAIAYNWTLPAGWSSQNTSAFVLVATAGETAGTVQLCVDAFVGNCMVTSCTDVQVLSGNGTAAIAPASDDWLTVQPNPSDGIFRIIPSGTATTDIIVYDGTGRVVKATYPMVGNRAATLDLAGMAPGAYYLMATRKGDQRVMKLVVGR